MFGKRLRYLRKKEKLSQLQLAQKLKVPNQNISNYEREFRSPDFETLKMIADFFGVTTDYLLGHELDDPNNMTDSELDEEIKEITSQLNVWYKSEPEDKELKLRMLRRMLESFEEDE